MSQLRRGSRLLRLRPAVIRRGARGQDLFDTLRIRLDPPFEKGDFETGPAM